VRSLAQTYLPPDTVSDENPPASSHRDQLFPYAPRWMKWMCAALFLYAAVNFVMFMVTLEGIPSRGPGGTYQLRGKDRGYYAVSAEVYHRNRALEARGFSGHWMLFYGAAMTAAASGRKFLQPT
jgi:hypothetical protein